jgi:hypothetical protein
MSSVGSDAQDVSRPPSQPYRPGTADASSRRLGPCSRRDPGNSSTVIPSVLGLLLAQFTALATRMPISQGKTQHLLRVDAGFTTCPSLADGGLRGPGPTRPRCTTPPLRFLFVAPRVWMGLPSDATSRRRPGLSPSLRLRSHLARGLAPREFCAMPGTHVRPEPRGSPRRLQALVRYDFTFVHAYHLLASDFRSVLIPFPSSGSCRNLGMTCM